MPRPRAKGASPKPVSRAPSKGKTSVATGAAGGTGLAIFAQALPEPWKGTILLLAPALSVLASAWGPRLLDFAVDLGRDFFDFARGHYHILRLKGFLKNQRARLKDPHLSAERRAQIEEQIADAEASIDNHEYELVLPSLKGDSISGLRKATGSEEGERANVPPSKALEDNP